MTHVLDGAEVSVLEHSQVLNAPPDLSQALLLPREASPPAPALITASDLPPAHQSLLVFAPPPTFPAAPAERTVIAVVHSVPADLPAPLVRPRRRFRLDWYESAIITLILSCMALGVYRLMWAIQP